MYSERLTVSRDEGFVCGSESRIHVGGVRLEPDGHLGAFHGDEGAAFLSAEPSGMKEERREKRRKKRMMEG